MFAAPTCRHVFAIGLLIALGPALAQEVAPSPRADAWRTGPAPATLEAGWKPARQALGFERGALGMQLDSGARLSIKSRRGGLALTLRQAF